MSWLSGIFSPDVVNKTVDAIVNTGDALFYTDEEKSAAAQKAIDTKLKMLPLFEPFKIAQRYIAFGFTLNFIVAFWVAVIFYAVGAQKLLDGFLLIVATFQLGWIMLAIIGFYFGGGFADSMKKGKQ